MICSVEASRGDAADAGKLEKYYQFLVEIYGNSSIIATDCSFLLTIKLINSVDVEPGMNISIKSLYCIISILHCLLISLFRQFGE